MTKARIRSIRAELEDARLDKIDKHLMASIVLECLFEIERLQRFTRRGEEPPTAQSEQPSLLPPAAKLDPKKKARGTQQEFEAFAESIELPKSDGEFLFHRLESTGWKNGRADVKDWRAVMRTWKTAKWLPSQKPTGNQVVTNRTEPARCIL